MSTAIPPTIYQRLTQRESVEAAVGAMKLFLLKGDREAFQQAVAIYCTAACDRGDQVQTVLGALCRLAEDLESQRPGEEVILVRPSEMHSLIFAGILRAFYGNAAVDRAAGASSQRRADAPQHVRGGTWPRRPAE
jgi:hypothetical protein